MRVRKVDASGDMVFGGGQSSFHRDTPDAVAQVVESRLNLWLRDWYLDLNEGTPYQTSVLGKYTENARDPVMQARILETPGVTELAAYSSTFDPQTRAFRLSAEIVTAYTALAPTGRVSSTANLNTLVYQDR